MGKLEQDTAVKGMHGTRGSTGAGRPKLKARVGPQEGVDLERVLDELGKFGMDPPPGSPSLTKAWMSDAPVEEDEAEFVDTLADCLGAGLSLQDALTCWETGDLASDDSQTAPADDELTVAIPRIVPRRPTGGHRLLVR